GSLSTRRWRRTRTWFAGGLVLLAPTRIGGEMSKQARRIAFCAVALVAAAAATGAAGDGLPVLGVNVGGSGIVAPSGTVRYVTLPAGLDTVVAKVERSGGRVLRSRLLQGVLTIPAVAYDGSAAGLSANGGTL